VAALKTVAVLLALAVSVPAEAVGGGPVPPTRIADWRPYVTYASLRFGIPAEWIEQVMRAESNGQTMLDGRPIRSRAGAIGLMQLMPATWEAMRRALGLGNDPDDPRDNILAGTFYMRLLYDRFDFPGLFAAYNAGPGRYAEHLATGAPLPGETIAYLGKVGATIVTPFSRPIAAPGTLFAVGDPSSPPANVASASQPPLLFAVKHEGP